MVGSGVECVGGPLVDIGGFAFFGEYPAARIGDGSEHVAVSEVDGPDEAFGRIWEQKRRWATAAETGIGPSLGD